MTKTEKKQQIHSLIDTVEDDNKLEEIQEFVNYMINEDIIEWESLSKEEQNSISKGLDQLNRGKKVDYEDVKKKYLEWLRK